MCVCACVYRVSVRVCGVRCVLSYHSCVLSRVSSLLSLCLTLSCTESLLRAIFFSLHGFLLWIYVRVCWLLQLRAVGWCAQCGACPEIEIVVPASEKLARAAIDKPLGLARAKTQHAHVHDMHMHMHMCMLVHATIGRCGLQSTPPSS